MLKILPRGDCRGKSCFSHAHIIIYANLHKRSAMTLKTITTIFNQKFDRKMTEPKNEMLGTMQPPYALKYQNHISFLNFAIFSVNIFCVTQRSVF